MPIVRPENGFLLYQHCRVNDYYLFKPIRRINLEIEVVKVSRDGKCAKLSIGARSVRPFNFSHEAEKYVETDRDVSSTLTLRDLLDQCIAFARQHFTESEVMRSKEEWKIGDDLLSVNKNNHVRDYM